MKRQYDAIDVMKYVSALLVICIHTAPFATVAPGFNFVLVQLIARTAVPFYFATSGFFLFKKLFSAESSDRLGILKTYSLRILKLYGIWTLIYLPIIVLNAKNTGNLTNIVYYLRNLLLNGSIYHLWFLPALVVGVWITYFLIDKLKMNIAFILTLVLYLIGMGINVYGAALENIPALSKFYEVFISIFETSRNGIFFAPVFLCIGAYISTMPRLKNKVVFGGLILSILLLCFEVQAISRNGFMNDLTSMYFMLIPFTFFLMQSLMRIKLNLKNAKEIRSMSTLLYVGHIWVVFILNLITPNNLIVGLGAIIISALVAFLLEKLSTTLPILKNLY